MPSVFLVRHGEYENPRKILPGRLPVELSNLGREQANKLHEFFKDKKISRIYSSEVLRCKQTAEIISGGEIPVMYDKRLLEGFSAYQGFWVDDSDGHYHDFYAHRDTLGGESLADIQKRVAGFWDEITLDLKENILICSHGDPLQVLYSYVKKLPLADEMAKEEDIPGWLKRGEYREISLI